MSSDDSGPGCRSDRCGCSAAQPPSRGVDGRSSDRESTPDDESGSDEVLPGIPGGGGDPSRRNVLMAAGGLAGASAASATANYVTGGESGATAAAQSQTADDTDSVQMGMAIDMNRCIACLKCVEACKRENNTDRGTHWMHVFRYEEDEYGETEEGYMPRPCQHCSDPSCTYVCPTQARDKRDSDGLVLTNYDTCIGCRYCEVACPYGVNFLGTGEPTDKSPGFFGDVTDDEGTSVGGPPPEGVMGKCTFCVHRQEDSAQRGTTACEDDCPVDAIHFGDMHDSESAPRRHLRDHRGEARFKLLDQTGNEPNIVYIGNEPSKDAEPIDGPYTYGDLGMETHAAGHEEATGGSPANPDELPDDRADQLEEGDS